MDLLRLLEWVFRWHSVQPWSVIVTAPTGETFFGGPARASANALDIFDFTFGHAGPETIVLAG